MSLSSLYYASLLLISLFSSFSLLLVFISFTFTLFTSSLLSYLYSFFFFFTTLLSLFSSTNLSLSLLRQKSAIESLQIHRNILL